LGTTLSAQKKYELNNILWQGFAATQVMQQYKEHVCDMALRNAPITRDTFVMPHDVQNLANQIDGSRPLEETPKQNNECSHVEGG